MNEAELPWLVVKAVRDPEERRRFDWTACFFVHSWWRVFWPEVRVEVEASGVHAPHVFFDNHDLTDICDHVLVEALAYVDAMLLRPLPIQDVQDRRELQEVIAANTYDACARRFDELLAEISSHS